MLSLPGRRAEHSLTASRTSSARWLSPLEAPGTWRTRGSVARRGLNGRASHPRKPHTSSAPTPPGLALIALPGPPAGATLGPCGNRDG